MPPEEKGLEERGDIGVDVFEVEYVCAVFRDILDVAIDVMFGLSTIVESFFDGLHIDEGINRIFPILLHSMHPHINVAIHFTHWIFP